VPEDENDDRNLHLSRTIADPFQMDKKFMKKVIGRHNSDIGDLVFFKELVAENDFSF
jgi:hypothetical protein